MRPWRTVTIPLVLGILCALLSACAEVPRPLSPGSSVSEHSGQSLVFGRMAMIRDGEDRMTSLPSFPRSFGWELLEAHSGKKFVVDPLTENGFFALPLPAGLYHVTKLRYEDRYGLWEGTLAASFSVKPGSLTYVGTWQITFAGLGPGTYTLRPGTVAEFEERYAINARPVTVALLESAPEGQFSLLRPRSEH